MNTISEEIKPIALLGVDHDLPPTLRYRWFLRCTYSRKDIKSGRRYFLKQLLDFLPLFNRWLTQNLFQLFAMNEAGFVGISDRFWDWPPQNLDNFIPKELPEVTLIWFLTKYILHNLCERQGLNAGLLHCLVFLGVVNEAEEYRLVSVKEIFWELIAFYDGAINSFQFFGRCEKVFVSFTSSWIYPVEVLFTVHFHEFIFNFFSKCPKYPFQTRISFCSLVVGVICSVGLLGPWWLLLRCLFSAYFWRTLYALFCLIMCFICLNIWVAWAKIIANGVFRRFWISSLWFKGNPLRVLGLKVRLFSKAIQNWIVTRRLTVVELVKRSYLAALVNVVVWVCTLSISKGLSLVKGEVRWLLIYGLVLQLNVLALQMIEIWIVCFRHESVSDLWGDLDQEIILSWWNWVMLLERISLHWWSHC